MTKLNNLKIGDKVKVRSGTMCPDLEGLNIGGWQGEIVDISKDGNNDKTLICIEWDNATLENMPQYFVDQGEKEGLANNLMYLYDEEVEIKNGHE